jgi:hypothetical protein
MIKLGYKASAEQSGPDKPVKIAFVLIGAKKN